MLTIETTVQPAVTGATPELNPVKIVADVTLLRGFFDYACPTHTGRMSVALNLINTFTMDAIIRRLWLTYKNQLLSEVPAKEPSPQLSLIFNKYPGLGQKLGKGETLATFTKAKLDEIILLDQVLNIMESGDPGKQRSGGYDDLFPAGFWQMNEVEEAMIQELTGFISGMIQGTCMLQYKPKDNMDPKTVTASDMDLNEQCQRIISKLFTPVNGLPAPSEEDEAPAATSEATDTSKS
jgi:hypothetical protein